MQNFEKIISFRISEEIYTIFIERYGKDFLPYFLRNCIDKANKKGAETLIFDK